MSVLLVDYGMGNLGSARRALEECGASVVVSSDAADLRHAERIVIPGVGAYREAMMRLRSAGWVDEIRACALDKKVPIMGICLGMQLLADTGTEGGGTPGFGLIPGRVERLQGFETHERVPHVGWNEVQPTGEQPLFDGIRAGSDFYFVHSYKFVPDLASDVAASTPYCGGFVSAVRRGVIFGVQFHPEKSSRLGFQLLRNFLAV